MTQLTDADLLDIANQLKGLAARLSPNDVAAPPVVETPTSSGTFKVNIVSGFGKTVVVPADNGIVKDEKVIQFANGRTTTVVGVDSASAGFMTITTSEPPADTDAGIAALSGTVATISDRFATPVAPSEPEQPEETSQPSDEAVPIAGLNMSGLSNNPYVENAITGQNYREPEQKYFDKYQAMGVKRYRFPIAPERCVSLNKGALAPEYLAMIRAALDKAQAAGAKGIIDPHSFMRVWTSVDAGATNEYGYQESNYKGFRKLLIPVGAPGCKLDVEGYADMLNKLTADLADHPAFYGIGIANEPYSASTDPFNVVTKYISDAQTYVDAIVAASHTVKIFVGGGEYCTALDWPAVSDGLKDLKDPYGQIIYEAHQYLDNNMRGGGQWSNRNEVIPVDNFVNMVKPFVDWLKANGKQGVIGEQGFPADNQSASDATAKGFAYLTANGVPFFQWCAGPGWPSDDVNAVDDDNLTYKNNLDAIKPFFGVTTTAYGKAPQ